MATKDKASKPPKAAAPANTPTPEQQPPTPPAPPADKPAGESVTPTGGDQPDGAATPPAEDQPTPAADTDDQAQPDPDLDPAGEPADLASPNPFANPFEGLSDAEITERVAAEFAAGLKDQPPAVIAGLRQGLAAFLGEEQPPADQGAAVSYVSAKTGGVSKNGQVVALTRGQAIDDPELIEFLKAQKWPLMRADKWAKFQAQVEG